MFTPCCFQVWFIGNLKLQLLLFIYFFLLFFVFSPPFFFIFFIINFKIPVFACCLHVTAKTMLFAHHYFRCRINVCIGCVGSTEGLQVICCERLSESLLRGPDKPNLHLPWEGCMRQVCFMLDPSQVAMGPPKTQTNTKLCRQGGVCCGRSFLLCVFSNRVEYIH